MQTLSEENYLKAIYRLSQQGDKKITPTAVAEQLNNNPASVIDMIKKLTDKQLISYDKRKGINLTKKGADVATLVVRKHRLWEVFLLDKLGYRWDEIHDIAEELEHISDDTLADRLDKFLGFPEYDPHGDPIPKANGKMPESYTLTLSAAPVGTVCRVAAVRDTSAEFLRYLHKLNISIGTVLEVKEKISFDDSIILGINNENETAVSSKFGENILIRI
ncbi:metal-dependent transcriptional regulator [Mucilaginibacter sp. RS28]|uniref:Transcriptional regulator MntR n=1 Tax=Mucilaginibacter straminoryzae TaxID=2932774 RepID=A0A9X1X686_9SPHI|nr:metal-dependent transcriptional regulator [Mucilaginibacter straminoryzae]MCJ8209404.1 metal-dependent transcriptional regulator [Mucilaginibacter straminoryzae]